MKIWMEGYSADEIAESEYRDYLDQHIDNVRLGYFWLRDNLPELLEIPKNEKYYGDLRTIIDKHDESKYISEKDPKRYQELTIEYMPYARYFYGNKTSEVKRDFDLAWLSHIHNNPHHWQHWILNNDEDGQVILDMPKCFIIEMICDWWSFSWSQDNLYEIFNWYDKHKSGILLSPNTRREVENILDKMKEKLDVLDEPEGFEDEEYE